MVQARSRTRNKVIAAGRTRKGPLWYGPYSIEIGFDRIDDSWKKKRDLYGLLPATNLYQLRATSNGCTVSGVINGHLPVGNVNRLDVHGHPAKTYLNKLGSIPSAHSSKDKGDTQYTNELLSKSNPFRDDYSVPVMAKELIEIATMFKFVHKSFANTAGGAYLNYKFGWEQFIRDIKTLGGITKVVERRLKEFNSLMSAGGSRRKVWLDQYSTPLSDRTDVIISAPAPMYVRAKVSEKWKTTVWGTCRWFPAPGAYTELQKLDKLQSFNLAVQSIFDLRSPSPGTLWNLIPWTWLIDYFVDIGGYLAALSNQSLATAEYCCILRTDEVRYDSTLVQINPGLFMSGSPGGKTTIKRRKVVPGRANLPTGFRLFNDNQAKVILALLLRFKS